MARQVSGRITLVFLNGYDMRFGVCGDPECECRDLSGFGPYVMFMGLMRHA